MWLKRTVLTTAAALALAAIVSPSSGQEARVAVGTLTCNVAPGTSFVFGSTRTMNCVYAGYNGQTERYVGEVLRYGIDIGYTNAATIMWAVVAGTRVVAPGALEGSYAGVAGAATPGAGAGASVLVGGSNRTISLQPVTIEGNTGLNIAAGIGEIRLRRP